MKSFVQSVMAKCLISANSGNSYGSVAGIAGTKCHCPLDISIFFYYICTMKTKVKFIYYPLGESDTYKAQGEDALWALEMENGRDWCQSSCAGRYDAIEDAQDEARVSNLEITNEYDMLNNFQRCISA